MLHYVYAIVGGANMFVLQCYWRAYSVGDVERMALLKLAKYYYYYYCKLISNRCVSDESSVHVLRVYVQAS